MYPALCSRCPCDVSTVTFSRLWFNRGPTIANAGTSLAHHCHGRDNEAIAIRKYQRYMHNIGHKVKVDTAGFVVRGDFPFLGCSPDGKVTDPVSHPHHGIVEVKCPHSYKSISPRVAAESDSSFYLGISDTNEFVLRKDSSYYYQVQGQMAITGSKWCDFIVYTFKGFSIQRLAFDEEMWNDMLISLEKFYIEEFAKHITKV